MKNLVLKRILLGFACVVLTLVIAVGCYLEYVILQYYRIEDNQVLEIVDKNELAININDTLTITTYNIGFGAYSRDYSFFMDEGYMKDGTHVVGKWAKARSREAVLTNTNGALEVISNTNSDFIFLQEVDKKATRSYNVNQYEMFLDEFSDYDTSYASNFHSAYLLYPFNDMIGKTEAGIVTMSKYDLESSERRSLPVDNSFPTRFFDLDRCFSVSRIKVSDTKELVLINVHLSAYDEGGIIRQAQMKMLNEVLKQEKEKGNYVVAGGDFNHDIVNSINAFPTEQKLPEWVYSLDDDDLEEGYRFISDNDTPTCRSSDMAYKEGVNYTVSIDGFIVSDNIEVISASVSVNDLFMYSDHNPVTMEFRLK